MIDSRFYQKKASLTIGEICRILGVDVPKGADTSKVIDSLARLDKGNECDITFFHNSKYKNDLQKTKAYACIIAEEFKDLLPANTIPLVVREPYLAVAYLLEEFYSIKRPGTSHGTFISDMASVSKTAVIEENCYISDCVTIGDGCLIKKGTFIGPNTNILSGVEIGENSYIESSVTIGFAIIGRCAYIKTGARIGQQGFGFHMGKEGIVDILQIGRVIIGENAQIGANTTIDRGSMSDTKIGSNVRIDNMVHIAHNVELGDYCVIAAQTGVAGSTKIGMGCVFGGQVGVAGHITIGDRVTVAAQSGIMKSAESGSKLGGTPAVGIVNWHKQTVMLRKLVDDRNK